MNPPISRRAYLGQATALGVIGTSGSWAGSPAVAGSTARGDLPIGWKLNRILVTPEGPNDGGDFGPNTQGTKTSGLQEALDAAKAHAKDVYLCGGSWTAGQTQPVVYFLHETLRIPWMQDFRLDSGHCVIHYARKTGDAVVFDSQMSCAYRFGLIVSTSDGAVVRLRPFTAGPDRFKVITSTEFHFNALVGGGGAWPGGEPYQSTLNQQHRWIGTGLWLDGSTGSIDGNRIRAVETVGCARGIHLTGACTHNSVEATLVHLCQTHVQIGDAAHPNVHTNRIQAHMESEGIADSVGARIFGHDNRLDLSFGQMADHRDVVFEAPAHTNLVHGIRFPHGITNLASSPTNRLIANTLEHLQAATPAVPPSGQTIVNRDPFPVEVRILDAGHVSRWSEVDPGGRKVVFEGGFHVGQSFLLNPADGISLEYQRRPSWVWKGIG